MIYLIGGSPRSGKTKLAKRLSEKLGIPWISTDMVRQIIIPYFPDKIVYKKLPFEKSFKPENIDKFFINKPNEILKQELIEAKTIWPGIKSLIKQLTINRTDCIIEGVHLLPKFVKGISKSKTKTIYLVKKDINNITKFIKRNDEFDWILSNTSNDAVLHKASAMISTYGKYFINEADRFGYKVINTEKDFDKNLLKAVNYLIK